MANAWISHVKAFQTHHGCSYKDALKRASASYKKLKGGNITKTAKTSGKQVITASGDRAVQAIEGSYGGKIGRVKKAGKWQQFVDSTLHDTIDTANKARKTYDKGQRSEMTSGFGLKRHRKLSGKALMPAGM